MFQRTLTYARIRRLAVRDRKHNEPSSRQTALSPSEQRIQGAVNLRIRALQDAYAKQAEPLKTKLRDAMRRSGQVDQPEWQRNVERTGRFQEQTTLGQFGHHLLMTCLTIGEIGFNVLAFATSGEATIFSIGMALAVTVAIPTLAYAAGLAARQYDPLSRKIKWVAGLSLVAVTMLFVINEMRVAYLNTQNGGDSPWFTTTLAYFAINVGCYVAGAVVTYLSKDPDAQFARAKERLEGGKQRIAQLRGRLNEMTKRLDHQSRMAQEAGLQAISGYRSENRLGRDDLPAYYDDDTQPHHRVAFVEVVPDELEAFQEEQPSELRQVDRGHALLEGGTE